VDEIVRADAVEMKMRSLSGIFRQVRNGSVKRISRILVPHFVKVEKADVGLELLGNGTGAWAVPTKVIHPEAICYCAGVGINATLDMALAAKFGCNVYSFDPTPRSIEYFKSLQYDRTKLQFLPIGMWSEDTQVKFFAPANPMHVNHSSVDLHGTGEYFTAECRRLKTLMAGFGHAHLDLLKLDIEGSWMPVLRDLVASKISLSALCVEFDSPTSLRRIREAVELLARYGLRVVHFQGENFTFVRTDLLTSAEDDPARKSNPVFA